MNIKLKKLELETKTNKNKDALYNLDSKQTREFYLEISTREIYEKQKQKTRNFKSKFNI